MFKSKERIREYYRDYYWRVGRESKKRYRARIKYEVFAHYSKGEPKCVHCGEEDLLVLCIDHINGGGTQERKRINQGGGAGFYLFLRKNDYPDGYQVLCANCNLRKEITSELTLSKGKVSAHPLGRVRQINKEDINKYGRPKSKSGHSPNWGTF